MNWLEKFLKDHNITTHTIAGAIAAAGVLYATDQSFHDAVVTAFQATPAWVHKLVAIIGPIYLAYHKSNKTGSDNPQPPAA